MKKNLEILDYEDKKATTGKRYVRFKTSIGWMSCFDSTASEALKELEGKVAQVEVIESGEFKNIKKCYGEADKVDEDGKEVEVEKISFESDIGNKDTSYYTSYAKDIFIALSEINNKEGKPDRVIDDVIEQSIDVVKKLKAAFEQ